MSDPVTALAARLRRALKHWRDRATMDDTDNADVLTREALAFVREQLPTDDQADETLKRAMTGACPHGKKKLAPCHACIIFRARKAFLRDLHVRLGGGK